jgi:hypothetical protein
MFRSVRLLRDYNHPPHSMKRLIVFHESSDVQQHTVDMNILPRQGDFFDLPDVSSRHLYPVERVIYRLRRSHGGDHAFRVPIQGIGARIELGSPTEK